MRRSLAVLVTGLCLFAVPAHAQRLPTGVSPTHYTLWFAPDLEKQTFRGKETIDVQISTPRTSITLNAAEITFGTVTITAAGRTQEARVMLDPKSEMATLTVPQNVPAGAASIAVTYTGILNDKLRGFYISNANSRSYAITQFEATDARRAFPSFDEPAYKATFDISLMIDAADTAISNGRQLSDTPGPEARKHTLTFSTTPKMSSYLVAMFVGDFVCRSGRTEDIPIRVCSTPDKLHLTGFALDATEQQVAFYNRFFGITYPFGKLDIIGVPDFAAGAMENTAAIAFREQLLLADPDHASLNTLKNVAASTAHEIAHQWFGDLVTMKWWDDIWLNEGFATWMEKKPLAEWKPEWRVEVDEVDDSQSALSFDRLRSTRAIRAKAETPDEINELFDGIAYGKTAAVLRMLEGYVGREPMRAGLTAYLRKYSYANAAGEDFWSEMTRVTGKPLDRIMKSFVDQAGAPVLTISTACSGGTSNITVTQQRFSAASNDSSSGSQTWVLPACFKTGNGAPRCEVIDRPTQTIKGGNCGDAVFANAGGHGYYLTDYAAGPLRALTRSASTLTPIERLSLLGDEWWMVRSGRHDLDGYLELAAALASDDTAAITRTLSNRLGFIADLVEGDQRSRFETWIRSHFGPAMASLGVRGQPGDDEQKDSRRASLLTIVGVAGNDAEVQRTARELATRSLDDASVVAPTLAATVMKVGALGGNAVLYDRYMAQVQRVARNSEEYYRVFDALAWFDDPALIRRTLDFTLTPAARSQDVGLLLADLMGRPPAREATWAFVKAHWSELFNKIGPIQTPEIVAATGNFCSLDAATDVRQFFAQNPVPSSSRTLQQSIERIESCAATRTRQSAPLTRYLAR